jgi:hypothetical protein
MSPDSEISQLSFQSDNIGYILQNLNNGTAALYDFPHGQKVLAINSYHSFEFETSLSFNTESTDLVMKYDHSKILMDDQEQFSMISLDDFQGIALGWSKEKLSTCGSNDNMFLGGHCNFGGEEVYKNFTNLPAHNMIRITANFHFFDKWEGEEAFMFFDHKPVWSDSYKWCDKVFLWYCKKYAINACGAEYPDRLSVPIDFICIIYYLFNNSSSFCQ